MPNPGDAFEIFDSLPSTQAVGLERLKSCKAGPGWVLAREQTKGVGRHGRTWVGAKGNFMASRWQAMQIDVRSVPQLSFVTALAIYEMLRPLVPDTDENLRIKWPNDILHKGRKLCGILVQTEAGERPGELGIIIGIGLNMRSAPALGTYETVSLREISAVAATVPIVDMLHKLNGHLEGVLDLWREQGFEPIAKAWFKRAYGREHLLSLTHEGVAVTGRISGLDPFGGLKLQSDAGEDYTITGGDITYGAG